MATPLGQITGELQDVREWATYGSDTGLPTVSSTKANTGSYSVRSHTQGKAIGVAFTGFSSVCAGFWLNHVGINVIAKYNRANIFTIVSATKTIIITWKSAGDSIAIAIDNVAVAVLPVSSANNFATNNQWIHVGLNYIAGAGGGISFWVDGISVLSYSSDTLENPVAVYCGGNNQIGTGTNFDAMVVGSNVGGGYSGWANYAYFDDFYVDGDIASITEAPPPDRFLFSLANGAGASAEWTPTGQATNIACVDEAVPNDDTDYVKAEAVGLVDLYTTADITLPTDYGIVSVIPIALAKRMASGPTVQLVAADGVSANLESAEKTPGTSYGYVWESMPLAPDGAAWDETKFNAAEFGLKSVGTF